MCAHSRLHFERANHMKKAKVTITLGRENVDLPMEKLIKHQEKLSRLKGSPAIKRAGKVAKDASKKFRKR
jgi:hypothetical protein